MTTRRTGVSVLAFSLAVLSVSAGFAQSVPAGTAKNAVGVLVVVRTDGVETRLQGRRALRMFEGDVLRMDEGVYSPRRDGRCHGRRLEPTAASLTLMPSRATTGLRPPSASHGPCT